MSRSTHTEKSPLVFLEATGIPALAADDGVRIIAWNRALQRLLGYSAEEVLGERCWEAICGRDVSGNLCCFQSCSVCEMLRRDEPVHSFEVDVPSASGGLVRLTHGTMQVPCERPSEFITVISLQPANHRSDGDDHLEGVGGSGGTIDAPASASALPGSVEGFTEMTAREIEILGYLAEGCTSKTVAKTLCIGVTTVRTHTQNILRKCAAHNMRQAISLARRHRLL